MTDDRRTSLSDVNFWSSVPASAKVSRRRSLPLLVPLVAVIVSVAAYRIYAFQGMLGLVMAAGVASVLLVATMLSLRHVETAILIWLISVLGFFPCESLCPELAAVTLTWNQLNPSTGRTHEYEGLGR